MRRDIPGQVPGRLVRSQITAHGENGHQVPFCRLFQLGVAPRQRTKVASELNPMFYVCHDVEHVSGRHALNNRGLQRDG
ncbi:hypothetical protein D9M70_570930 [compost metagenome]